MTTLSTLETVQRKRAAVFPEKFADNPFRATSLSTLQQRNAVLDAVFYDVGTVTPEETPQLAFWLAREGAVVVVPPTGAGFLRIYKTPEDFLDQGEKIAALAVAGVGSSALGAAAFARNVADALGEPVAAVVSGYGLADVATEALGGFFWFGALNSIRHMFEPLDAFTKLFTKSEQSLEETNGVEWTRTSRDTQTVIALLRSGQFTGKLLIGHSKGNLVISEALYAIDAEDEAQAKRLGAATRIVTISAKIGMPRSCRQVLDVVGQWDWFGALNSRPDIAADYTVPRAWHSTNPEFPLGMGIHVTDTLKRVLPMFDAPRQPEKAISALPDLPQRMAGALYAARERIPAWPAPPSARAIARSPGRPARTQRQA
jgi:hypothetical protein